MTLRRNPARRARAGFTLVEALVATALMGLILGLLATVTAQWMPNWSRGFSRLQRAELLQVAIERIVGDISAAEFVSSDRDAKGPLFDGGELALTFVRTASGPNAAAGIEIVRIGETADRGGPALVRARAPFVPGGAQPFFADPVVLLRAPYRVFFAYAGQDGVWQNQWRDADRLPVAVRLAVRDAAGQRLLPVSTVALIHTELPAACANGFGGDVCDAAADAGAKTAVSSAADASARSPR